MQWYWIIWLNWFLLFFQFRKFEILFQAGISFRCAKSAKYATIAQRCSLWEHLRLHFRLHSYMHFSFECMLLVWHASNKIISFFCHILHFRSQRKLGNHRRVGARGFCRTPWQKLLIRRKKVPHLTRPCTRNKVKLWS